MLGTEITISLFPMQPSGEGTTDSLARGWLQVGEGSVNWATDAFRFSSRVRGVGLELSYCGGCAKYLCSKLFSFYSNEVDLEMSEYTVNMEDGHNSYDTEC